MNLVPTSWLVDNLGAARLRVLDATWFMAGSGRDAGAEFVRCHIPGALRFDLDRAADPHGALSHTLPSKEHFADYVDELGIVSNDRIVIYDGAGTAPAARVWWMFKVFGHEAVHVLNGGLPKWVREGRTVAVGAAGDLTSSSGVRDAQFVVSYVPARAADFITVQHAVKCRVQIADARPPGRFLGSDPEPRPGVRGGHIPGSFNVRYTALIDPVDGTVLPPEKVTDIFRRNGIDPTKPVICSCGSGVTACVLALALDEAGNGDVAVYDGSWSEWAMRTGPSDSLFELTAQP